MQKSFVLILLFAASLLGCGKPTESQNESVVETSKNIETPKPIPTGDNSQTSLDWAGTYFAVLPCPSCEGIETWVTLNPDGTFELKTNYLGLNDAREETFTGKFEWNETGSNLRLLGMIGNYTGRYKIGENRIWQLDKEGNRIEGELADRYILTKK